MKTLFENSDIKVTLETLVFTGINHPENGESTAAVVTWSVFVRFKEDYEGTIDGFLLINGKKNKSNNFFAIRQEKGDLRHISKTAFINLKAGEEFYPERVKVVAEVGKNKFKSEEMWK